MKLFYFLFLLVLFSNLVSCNADEPVFLPSTGQSNAPEIPGESGKDDDNDNNDNLMGNQLEMSVGNTSFRVSLEDNAAAEAFKALLPLMLNMSELNGNEKFFNLSTHLPVAASRPGTIRMGDLMLYGSNCLVLFYESFSSSYSYTRIGRVDNPSELAVALGRGNTTVLFKIATH